MSKRPSLRGLSLMRIALPGQTVRQRVDVSCFPRRFPLLSEPARVAEPSTPPTQELRTPPHIEADEIPTPLGRRLMIEARIPNATAAEISSEIEGMNRAAEHGGDPSGDAAPTR
jgi:hypothetical protein